MSKNDGGGVLQQPFTQTSLDTMEVKGDFKQVGHPKEKLGFFIIFPNFS